MAGPECDVCWGSHSCGLPPRHDGNHVCSPDDPDGPCEPTMPRDGGQGDFQWDLYGVDLIRYSAGDFCDLCGPIDVAAYANPLLDHAMLAHPDRWAEEYAEKFSDYLGAGRWRERINA